jgi:hypothetical protein
MLADFMPTALASGFALLPLTRSQCQSKCATWLTGFLRYLTVMHGGQGWHPGAGGGSALEQLWLFSCFDSVTLNYPLTASTVDARK